MKKTCERQTPNSQRNKVPVGHLHIDYMYRYYYTLMEELLTGWTLAIFQKFASNTHQSKELHSLLCLERIGDARESVDWIKTYSCTVL